MANHLDLEELQHNLLAGGDFFPQGMDEIRSLAGAEAREAVQVLARQIGDLTQSDFRPATASSNPGLTSSPVSNGGALTSLAGDVAKTSGSFLLKGLTLAPFINGLLGLFRRDNPAEEAAPVRFSLPAPIKTEAGLAVDGQTISIDRGAGDRIRPLRQPDSQLPQLYAGRGGTQTGSVASQNITVQVNAMDSRSFLDHSEDIAMAVREAMLHSHSLNDMVNDL